MIKILNNQSVFDVAIQYTGNVSNAFVIAKYNNLAIHQELTPGQEIETPKKLIVNKDIVDFYKKQRIIPGTALTTNDITNVNGCEGIECWVIEHDFIVS